MSHVTGNKSPNHHVAATTVNRRARWPTISKEMLPSLTNWGDFDPITVHPPMNDWCVWSGFVLLHNIDIFPLTPYAVFPHKPRMSSPLPLDESRTDMDPSRRRRYPYVLDFSFERLLQRGLSLVICFSLLPRSDGQMIETRYRHIPQC